MAKNTLGTLIEILGVTLEELRGDSHERRVTGARTMLAAALPLTQQQLAALLNCSQPAVHKMRRRHLILLRYDKEYQARWNNLSMGMDPQSANGCGVQLCVSEWQ